MLECEKEVEELVISVKNGCYDRFDKLSKLCVFIPRSALDFLPKFGFEQDDLYQEAVIALLKAIHSYDPKKGAGFRTYSSICIRRHFLSAIRSANRYKNVAMVDYLPLDENVPSDFENPEEIWIEKESYFDSIGNLLSGLSALEKEVLTYYLKGISIKDISVKLSKNEKSVYNALRRIRQKLKS